MIFGTIHSAGSKKPAIPVDSAAENLISNCEELVVELDNLHIPTHNQATTPDSTDSYIVQLSPTTEVKDM